MKFKYTGDNDSIEMYGYTFPKGEPVEIDEKAVAYTVKRKSKKIQFDVLTVDKLKRNPEFEQVKLKPGPKPKVTNGDTSGSTQPSSE